VGWAPEPVWTRWRGEEIRAPCALLIYKSNKYEDKILGWKSHGNSCSGERCVE